MAREPKPKYWIEAEDGEVYEGHRTKIVMTIQSLKRITIPEAAALLEASTLDNPIELGKEKAWREDD